MLLLFVYYFLYFNSPTGINLSLLEVNLMGEKWISRWDLEMLTEDLHFVFSFRPVLIISQNCGLIVIELPLSFTVILLAKIQTIAMLSMYCLYVHSTILLSGKSRQTCDITSNVFESGSGKFLKQDLDINKIVHVHCTDKMLPIWIYFRTFDRCSSSSRFVNLFLSNQKMCQNCTLEGWKISKLVTL
jgi:hypothetical protein